MFFNFRLNRLAQRSQKLGFTCEFPFSFISKLARCCSLGNELPQITSINSSVLCGVRTAINGPKYSRDPMSKQPQKLVSQYLREGAALSTNGIHDKHSCGYDDSPLR